MKKKEDIRVWNDEKEDEEIVKKEER